MLAFAMMATIRHRANPTTPPKNGASDDQTAPALIRWSVQEIRRIATHLAQRRIQPAHIIAWSLFGDDPIKQSPDKPISIRNCNCNTRPIHAIYPICTP